MVTRSINDILTHFIYIATQAPTHTNKKRLFYRMCLLQVNKSIHAHTGTYVRYRFVYSFSIHSPGIDR